MHNDIPKQFLELNGIPIIFHTLNAFSSKEINIIIVIHKSYLDYWQSLCEKYKYNTPHKLTVGGKTRFHSVKNGLKCLFLVKNGKF